MKRYLVIVACVLLAAFAAVYAYARYGVYVSVGEQPATVAVASVEGKQMYLGSGDGREPIEVRGVDLGSAIPGHFATDYVIDEETYARWLGQIAEAGANVIRVHTLQNTAFYQALYEYDTTHDEPLYLLQGVWVDDYADDSHMDAFDDGYLGTLKDDIRTAIDAIHGQRVVELGEVAGTGTYVDDVSPWVLGYLIGVDWNPSTVVFTNQQEAGRTSFEGTYLQTTEDASPFECALAQAGEEAFRYETDRYREQRLVSLSNYSGTDPFSYSHDVAQRYDKYASVDTEHIVQTGAVVSGTFASYHVDGIGLEGVEELDGYVELAAAHPDATTYELYLRLLDAHHAGPVLVSAFGTPSSRGTAQVDDTAGRNLGGLDEVEQAEALEAMYHDIQAAGVSGAVLFEWQDEWYRRAANTMVNVDLEQAPLWSDAQTAEQGYGLLAFDPGSEQTAAVVDGDASEWDGSDVVATQDGRSVSARYDERYLYLLVSGDGVGTGGAGDVSPLYLPVDTTQKSGSATCANPAVSFDRAADFLVCLEAQDQSRVLVQARSNVLRATRLLETEGIDPFVDPPAADSAEFDPIRLMLLNLAVGDDDQVELLNGVPRNRTYETGVLKEGNADPAAEGYDSNADFCLGAGVVEVRLPWQLLNFADPAHMRVHDDYYAAYGVETQDIETLYVGVGTGEDTIRLSGTPMRGWGDGVTYHERLKPAYWRLQELWGSAEGDGA